MSAHVRQRLRIPNERNLPAHTWARIQKILTVVSCTRYSLKFENFYSSLGLGLKSWHFIHRKNILRVTASGFLFHSLLSFSHSVCCHELMLSITSTYASHRNRTFLTWIEFSDHEYHWATLFPSTLSASWVNFRSENNNVEELWCVGVIRGRLTGILREALCIRQKGRNNSASRSSARRKILCSHKIILDGAIGCQFVLDRRRAKSWKTSWQQGFPWLKKFQ